MLCVWTVFAFFWHALLYVFSSFAIISKRTRELVALLLLPFGCYVTCTVKVPWLFLAVPWDGLQLNVAI